jgi:molecular chaperone GrpE
MKKEKEQKIPEKKADKKAKKLSVQLEDLKKEKAELFEKLQRVSADYANYQKRGPKQIADSIAYEKKAILKSFLPALDNFEHTLAAEQTAEDVEGFAKGVRIVYDQMLTILKSHGVEPIDALGEKFNPAIHEAMMQKHEPEQEDNVVLEEFQKGYKLNDQVIRPGKVIVNKQPAEPDESTE